jgi:hypothetical protein
MRVMIRCSNTVPFADDIFCVCHPSTKRVSYWRRISEDSEMTIARIHKKCRFEVIIGILDKELIIPSLPSLEVSTSNITKFLVQLQTTNCMFELRELLFKTSMDNIWTTRITIRYNKSKKGSSRYNKSKKEPSRYNFQVYASDKEEAKKLIVNQANFDAESEAVELVLIILTGRVSTTDNLSSENPLDPFKYSYCRCSRGSIYEKHRYVKWDYAKIEITISKIVVR